MLLEGHHTLHRCCASFQSYPQKYLFSMLEITTGLGVVGSIVGLGGCGPFVSMQALHGVFVKHISPRGVVVQVPRGAVACASRHGVLVPGPAEAVIGLVVARLVKVDVPPNATAPTQLPRGSQPL